MNYVVNIDVTFSVGTTGMVTTPQVIVMSLLPENKKMNA